MDLIGQWSFSWIGTGFWTCDVGCYDKLLLIFLEGWPSLEVYSVRLSWFCCSRAWMLHWGRALTLQRVISQLPYVGLCEFELAANK
jgi:hypothetical protein